MVRFHVFLQFHILAAKPNKAFFFFILNNVTCLPKYLMVLSTGKTTRSIEHSLKPWVLYFVLPNIWSELVKTFHLSFLSHSCFLSALFWLWLFQSGSYFSFCVCTVPATTGAWCWLGPCCGCPTGHLLGTLGRIFFSSWQTGVCQVLCLLACWLDGFAAFQRPELQELCEICKINMATLWQMPTAATHLIVSWFSDKPGVN